MFAFTRWLSPVGLVLLAWLLAAEPAAAQSKNKLIPLNGVDDPAGLFSPEAIATARRQIEEIKRADKKDLVIETFATAPEQYKDGDPKKFGPEWAVEKFKKHRVDGVYVLICKQPPILRVVLGDMTRIRGSFTATNRDELANVMLAKLKESKKVLDAAGEDEAEKKAAAKKAQALRDEALLQGVAYVRTHMEPPAPVRGGASGKAAGAAPPRESFWSTPGGYIVIGLGILLVLWLIIGVIRALAGGGRGAPGYAGGGGGGGGGGFGTSLLGGLFGAMAGMWLYNNLFGGHMSSASAADPGTGGDYGGSDVGGDASTSGGDYGADGGGDAGGDAGGGDWGGGGGGDAGGGGDWGGGGGGDFGGGGDWGGGGGGDFGGGGGGDW